MFGGERELVQVRAWRVQRPWGLGALRTCSTAHEVVTWPWALRVWGHLCFEVV